MKELDVMKDTVFLIVSPQGVQRIRKQVTGLGPYEVAVRLEVTIPDSAFDELSPTARLDIPAEAIMRSDIDVAVEPQP